MYSTIRSTGKLFCFVSLLSLVAIAFGCSNNPYTSDDNLASTKDANDSADAKSNSSTVYTDTLKAQATNDATVNTDWLLIPGVSAGQTKIGENADSIYQRLGKPDGGDAAMQKAVAIWYSHHDSTAHSIAIYTARNTDSPAIARVLQIRITSPSFTTKDGIHTSSDLAEIQSKFKVKQTENYEDAAATYKVYDSKEGIAFEINRNNKCVAIIIHKAGVTGEGTYLKFRTTNHFIDE